MMAGTSSNDDLMFPSCFMSHGLPVFVRVYFHNKPKSSYITCNFIV